MGQRRGVNKLQVLQFFGALALMLSMLGGIFPLEVSAGGSHDKNIVICYNDETKTIKESDWSHWKKKGATQGECAPPPVFECPTGTEGSDLNSNGVVDEGECNTPLPPFECPVGTEGSDLNDNGLVDDGECNTPLPPFECPVGTEGSDTNSNGVVDDGECNVPPAPEPPVFSNFIVACGGSFQVDWSSSAPFTIQVNDDSKQVIVRADLPAGSGTFSDPGYVSSSYTLIYFLDGEEIGEVVSLHPYPDDCEGPVEPFMKVIGSATAVCEGSVTISLETDYIGRAGIGLLLANGTDPVRFFDVNGSGTYSVVVGQFSNAHFPAEYTVFFGDNETVAENGVGQIDIDCSPVEPEPISRYACVPIDKLGNYELRHFESQEAYDAAIAAGAISATADTKCPTAPSTEIPGTETPGTETPGTETPGTEVPGTETPGTETPGTETPGTETPGTKTPDKPDTGQVQATSTPGVPVVVAPPSTGAGQDQISVWGYMVGAALSAAILIAGGVSLNLRRK